MTAFAELHALHATTPVRRAWPRPDGAIDFEARDDHGCLRAGRLDPHPSLAPFATDSKLPGLAETAAAGELVVHRLGRRAVVIQPDRAVKLLRTGRAPGIAAQSRTVGAACRAAGLGAAQVLAETADRLDFSLVPGTTLHDLGDGGIGGWRQFADRWPALARRRVGLPTHTAAAEAAVLSTWLTHAERFSALPRLEAVRLAVAATCAALGAGSPDPETLVHRDLHDKQLVWDGATLGVLDLDTAASGEAALDLANLAVHLDLRLLQGALSPAARDTALGLVEQVAVAVGATPARLTAYAQAARLRLACLYAFRPAAAGWLPRWLEAALIPSPAF